MPKRAEEPVNRRPLGPVVSRISRKGGILRGVTEVITGARFVALRATMPVGDRRSAVARASRGLWRCAVRGPPGRGADRGSAFQAVSALFLRRKYPLSLCFARRCRSEDRRSQPSALPFKWWRRRESNPRPKVFCNDVYMHIRVVGGNPRPKAPFPLSVPRRINPANRGSEPIPCAHRRLGKTAGKARLGRRPFPPGRRGQEERGYLSSQCQFSVGFCFVSTVYERWTPDMQSLLHIPSSNPVRPPSSRD